MFRALFSNLCLTEHLAIAHVVSRRQGVQTAAPRLSTVDATCGVFRVVLWLVPEIEAAPHQQLGLTIQHAGLGREERPPPPQYLRKLRIRTFSTATKDSAGGLHVPRAFRSDNSTTRWKRGNFTQGTPDEWQDADIYLLSTTGSPRCQVGYTVL